MRTQSWRARKLAVLLVSLVTALLVVNTAPPIASAQSGQVVLDNGSETGSSTFGTTNGAVSQQVVAGPLVDLPLVEGFWANLDWIVTDNQIRVYMPSVAWENEPVRVWACMQRVYGTHQDGAAIGGIEQITTNFAGFGSTPAVATGNSGAWSDNSWPNGNGIEVDGAACVSLDLVAPAAGLNVPLALPEMTLSAVTHCNACGSGGIFNYDTLYSPLTTGAPVTRTINLPRVIPQSGQDDFVVISGTGNVVAPLPNDEDALHEIATVDTLYITSVTSTDGRATCTLEGGDQTVNIVPAIDPATGKPFTSGVCEYYYDSKEVDGYDLSKDPVGPVKIYWNVLEVGAPIAVPDTASTDATYADAQGTTPTYPVVIDVLGNDFDPDGTTGAPGAAGEVVLDSVTQPANGTAVMNADGTVGYTPNPGFCGTDVFGYTITDADGKIASSTISVTVACNETPSAVDDWDMVDLGASVSGDVSLNDGDDDPDTGWSYKLISGPTSAASFTLNPDGTFTYTHNGDPAITSDTFTYEVCDGHKLLDGTTVYERCAQATATIELLLKGNNPPVAVTDTAKVDAWYSSEVARATGNTQTSVEIDVLGNDTDPDGNLDPASVKLLVTPDASEGTLTNNGDGTFTFTPADGFSGVVVAVYEVCDDPTAGFAGEPLCANASIIINVRGNLDVIAGDDTASTEVATAVTVPVLGNDLDPAGETLAIAAVDAASANGGTVVNNGDGTVTYTPAAGFTGADTFTYTVCDDHADLAGAPWTRCEVATVTVQVTQPAASTSPDSGYVDSWYSHNGFDKADGTGAAQAQTSVTVDVTANDTNVVPGTVALVGTLPLATVGTVTNNGDGTLTFTPADRFAGTVEVTYTVEDLAGNVLEQRVTFVAVGNAAPVPTSVAPQTVVAGGTVTTTISAVDDNGSAFTFSQATAPANGTITVGATDGKVVYTPKANFTGTDSYQVRVCDNYNAGAESTTVSAGEPWVRCNLVTVSVTVTNGTPEALNDTANTPYQTPITIDVLGNDSDPEGSALTIKSVQATTTEGGTAAIVDGKVVYTPKAGFRGVDSFTYTIVDPEGNEATATTVVLVDVADTDSDGDGIADWIEIIICGTPTCADGTEDADGDGIPDWMEIIICGTATCADPDKENAIDSDGDGIPDWVEIIICGTKTCADGTEDTDGDGIPDWVEILICGSKTCVDAGTDTDGDGIADWIEFIICGTTTCADGTEDSDGDGIADWIEIIICGTKTCADADTDSDGDGIADYIEIIICGSTMCANGKEDADGDGIPDYIEIIICGTATCANPDTDSNGNGIPDWMEIQACGSLTCVDALIARTIARPCTNATGTFSIPGTVDYRVPNGFRSNANISVFLDKSSNKLYSGPNPDSGTVSLAIPAGTSPGTHRFITLGIDDITGAVKVDGCSRTGALASGTTTGGTTGGTTTGGTTTGGAEVQGAAVERPAAGSGTPLAFTGAVIGGVLLLALGLLGSGVISLGARRRREDEA